MNPFHPVLNRFRHSEVFIALLTATFYYLGAKAGVYFSILSEGITLFWPPNAFLLVALLLNPYRSWRYIIPAVLLAEVIADVPTFTVGQALAFGLVNIFECTVAALIMRSLSQQSHFTFSRFRSVVLFSIGALLFASGTAAVLGASVYFLTTDTQTGFLTFWRIWWFGDALGLLILTPLLLAWLGKEDGGFFSELSASENASAIGVFKERFYELALLAITFVGTALYIFSRPEAMTGEFPLGPVVLVLFFIWAAIRFGLKGVSLLNVAVAFIAVYFTFSGLGPFSSGEKAYETLLLQEFLAALALSSMLVTALLDEMANKNRHLHLLDRAIATLDEGVVIAEAGAGQRVVFCNKGVEKLTGYSKQEVLGSNMRFLQPEGEDQSKVREEIRQALSIDRPSRSLLLNQHKDGHEFWNDMIITPVIDLHGQFSHYIGILHDVTDRVNSEKALRKAKLELEQVNQQLEQRVYERTQALESLNKELKRLAATDELTKIANRRAGMQKLDEEFSRAQRYQRDLVVLMCDLDFFKRVNDQYGHAMGDKVILAFVDVAQAELRKQDLIARFGGEEFIILMPETTILGAEKTAQRICQSVRVTQVQTPEGEVLHFSVSIGGAVCNAADECAEQLLSRADSALYEAKEKGRDQVVIR
ncbi:diguanylate cyclase [Thiomicrorhabdus indica]|uniref:sensor domain-containing diguanylate cyclase n=1 Tax=Thiomicrorhabdus indica TaxID=2267253 RepID=UPI002AA6B7A3|nr:diguanylate cyclase [Thiomicrorhabdus indica]